MQGAPLVNWYRFKPKYLFSYCLKAEFRSTSSLLDFSIYQILIEYLLCASSVHYKCFKSKYVEALTHLILIQKPYTFFYCHFWIHLFIFPVQFPLTTRTKLWTQTKQTCVFQCNSKTLLRKEWLPTPVFLPGEFHDRGPWQAATVHGVTKSRTQLSDFYFLWKFNQKQNTLVHDVTITYTFSRMAEEENESNLVSI